MPTTNLRNWDRFLLLLWKSFYLLWHNRKQMVFLFMMPFIICLPVMIFRFNISPEFVGSREFKPIDLDEAWKKMTERIETARSNIKKNHPKFVHSVFVPSMILGFAPDIFPAIKETLQTKVSELSPPLRLVSFPNCRALEEHQMKGHYFAGICFHSFDEWEDDDESQEDDFFMNTDILNFSLIFPSELRYFDKINNIVGSHWQTNDKFDFSSSNLRRTFDNDGGFVGYVREGFIILQKKVTEGFLAAFKLPAQTVELQRFPHQGYIIDPMDNLIVSSPMLVLCGFLIPVLTFTFLVTSEKEKQLKMYVRALGVPNLVIFSVWYVIGSMLFFFNSVLILATLKLPLSGDFAIFTKSNSICLLIILLAYSVGTTGFCIFISSFFNSCISSVSLAGIMWIITFVPFISVLDSDLVYYLCLNTVMATAFETIRIYEIMNNGLQFEYMFDKSEALQKRCGVITLLFLAHGLVYMILALITEAIVPKIIEKSKSCNNFLMKPEKKRGDVSNKRVSSLVDPLSSRVAQVEPLYKKQLVSLESVYKMYGKNEVVRDVNLNLYENDITILLGHNGCGKTSLLSLILGIKPLTEGVIHIEHYNLQEYKYLACSNIGGCLKTSLLYDDLTVENQIKFFSRLKGLSWKQCDIEVEKYCRRMQLTDKRKTLTRHLTIGLKQILAVSCAFAGESKVVILDEPTYGMDFSAAKLVVSLVESEKRNRTIFWSTNSVEIADVISDRIAIMAGGEIVCSGSITFLRNMYNNGRRLVIIKGDGLKEENVTKFIQQHIPDIQMESNFIRTLNYTIHETYSHKIADMLVALEEAHTELSIDSFSVEDVSIIDVILNMGSDFPHDIDPRRKQRIVNGETLYSATTYNKINIPNEEVTFRKMAEFKALFNTRFIYHLRHKWLFLSQLIFPVTMTIWMFTNSTESGATRTLNPLRFELDQYPRSTVLLGEGAGLNEQIGQIRNEYKEMVFWMDQSHKIKSLPNNDFSNTVKQYQRDTTMEYERKCMVGVNFQADKITAYFNNFPLHTAPLALNLVYNAMGRQGNEETKVFVRLKPLPADIRHKTVPLYERVGGFYNYVIMLMLTSLITWSNSVYDMTQSTGADFKHWLILSGATIFDFWFITFCFDLLRTVILVTAITITILVCLTISVVNTKVLVVFYIVLLNGGICTFSVQYLLAKIIKSEQPCFRTALLFAVFGIGLFILDNELQIRRIFPSVNIIRSVFLFHPYYAFGDGLLKVFQIHHFLTLCNNEDIFYLVEQNPNLEPKCAEIGFFNFRSGVTENLLSFLFITITSWALISILESSHKFSNFWIFAIQNDESESAWEDHKKLHGPDAPKSLEDDNVVREKIIVDTMSAEESRNVLLTVNRLGKIFGVVEALHRFSFYLDKSLICGILGLNGAGKSVLIKILADVFRQTYGEVKIFGEESLKNPRRIYSYIGYCPQELESIMEYTPGEILEIFAGIKGIPPKKIVEYCEALAKLLGFYEYYDRVLNICSDGTVKRVAAAVSLMGNPTLIYADEPLSAIDMHGKLLFFNLWNRHRNQGRSVLFTSLNPTECQSFCNKVLIMLNGRLVESGSLSNIYKRLEHSYSLRIRLKPSHSFDDSKATSNVDNALTRIIALVQRTFTNATFQNADGNLLLFSIPVDQDIGEVFAFLRNNAFTYNIESFGLYRTPLQGIYLNLVDRSKQVPNQGEKSPPSRELYES